MSLGLPKECHMETKNISLTLNTMRKRVGLLFPVYIVSAHYCVSWLRHADGVVIFDTQHFIKNASSSNFQIFKAGFCIVIYQMFIMWCLYKGFCRFLVSRLGIDSNNIYRFLLWQNYLCILIDCKRNFLHAPYEPLTGTDPCNIQSIGKPHNQVKTY